jgi:hypothetical protein
MAGDNTSVEKDSSPTTDPPGSPENGVPLEEISQISIDPDIHAPGNDLIDRGVSLALRSEEFHTERERSSGPLVYQ